MLNGQSPMHQVQNLQISTIHVGSRPFSALFRALRRKQHITSPAGAWRGFDSRAETTYGMYGLVLRVRHTTGFYRPCVNTALRTVPTVGTSVSSTIVYHFHGPVCPPLLDLISGRPYLLQVSPLIIPLVFFFPPASPPASLYLPRFSDWY